MRTHRYILVAAALAAAGCASSYNEEEPSMEGLNGDFNDLATISEDSARVIAMGYLPGFEVHQTELEPYQGGLWYEFELVRDDSDTELRVDANSGKIFEPATREQQTGQLQTAPVVDARARQIALTTLGGGRIIKADIEVEDGVLLYTYEVVRPREAGVTIIDIDATTGNVIAQSHQMR